MFNNWCSLRTGSLAQVRGDQGTEEEGVGTGDGNEGDSDQFPH
jgi:hypothetical protein